MSKYEIYAKRDKVFQFDVLTYDSLPAGLRVQIRYIWQDAFGLDSYTAYIGTFTNIRNYICREMGMEYLYKDAYREYTHAKECEMYLKHGQDVKILLSLIEMSMLEIEDFRKRLEPIKRMNLKMDQEEAIADLNLRFRESGVGYEFVGGKILQKDSEILHEEVVKPALYLLQEQDFDGALEEFLIAHEHYKKGHYGDCILNAGKAFESTMKTIGYKEAWGLTGRENASDLIQLLVQNQVIPSYLQTTLQGLGTLRNKVAGHGQGQAPVPVPEHFVNYALHLCGTNIVMLIEAYKEYKKIL